MNEIDIFLEGHLVTKAKADYYYYYDCYYKIGLMEDRLSFQSNHNDNDDDDETKKRL